MEWTTPGRDEARVMRVVYRYGECVADEEEKGRKKDSRLGFGHDDHISLAEEGLGIVARKMLESKREGLKLNESATVINNLVKRIRRSIESRCESLKRDVDASAEEAYVSLNGVLNAFCEEGKSFKESLSGFNAVMQRCKEFIEDFKMKASKGGELEDGRLSDGGNSEEGEFDEEGFEERVFEDGERSERGFRREGPTEQLMEIVNTLLQTHSPLFDFNLALQYEPNNNPLPTLPVGKITFECKKGGNELGGEGDSKADKPSSPSPESLVSKEEQESETFSFKNIRDLIYWRSVECVDAGIKPLGLVLLQASSILHHPSAHLSIHPSSSSSRKTPSPVPPERCKFSSSISNGQALNPLSTNTPSSICPCPVSSKLQESGGETTRNYLLLSSSSHMEIFDENLSQLLRCLKVHSVQSPVDVVSWNEWVAISSSSSSLIHVICMNSKNVSKFPIPGGCGNLSVDSEGKITITSRDARSIVIFDAHNNKLARISLPPSITKITHAVHYAGPPFATRPNVETPEKEVFVVCQVDKFHRVCMLNSSGNVIRTFGGVRGSEQGQMNRPEYVVSDGRGHFIVCDSGNCRLLVLNHKLQLVKEIGLKPLQIGIPSKIQVDMSRKLLFVTDSRNHCIVVTRFNTH